MGAGELSWGDPTLRMPGVQTAVGRQHGFAVHNKLPRSSHLLYLSVGQASTSCFISPGPLRRSTSRPMLWPRRLLCRVVRCHGALVMVHVHTSRDGQMLRANCAATGDTQKDSMRIGLALGILIRWTSCTSRWVADVAAVSPPELRRSFRSLIGRDRGPREHWGWFVPPKSA